MNVDEMMTGVRDAMQARTVFGEPIERDGMTIVPAAKVRGGGGGGGDEANNGGGGFGLSATPAGAYVIRGGAVEWQPAIDVNRIVLGGQVIAVIALLVLRTWIKSRALTAPGSARARRASTTLVVRSAAARHGGEILVALALATAGSALLRAWSTSPIRRRSTSSPWRRSRSGVARWPRSSWPSAPS